MDGIDHVFSEFYRAQIAGRIQTAVSVWNAVNIAHTVVADKTQGKELYDLIQSGAESSGSEDGGAAPCGIVIDHLSGSGAFKCRDRFTASDITVYLCRIHKIGDAFIIANELLSGDG